MGLEIVADFGGMWQESTANVAAGLSGLGTSDLAETVQTAADALDIFAGLAQMGSVAAAIIMVDTAKETAEAVTKTAMASANPLTWPTIALALGAAATAATVVYGTVRAYDVRADLSTPSGITAMGQTLGALA